MNVHSYFYLRSHQCQQGFFTPRRERFEAREKWWTRSQRIRTFGEIPFEVALLEAEERPVYQRIAEEVVNLVRLGMRNSAIARRLNVDAKTVAKGLKWRR